jgi:PEP-CTERM motif
MNVKVKYIVAAAALSGFAGTASAQFNVGGLELDEGPIFEVASIYENVVTGVGQTLRGFGEVTQINGVQIGELCGGCELTFRFDDYVVTSLAPEAITFSGGVVDFYLGFGANNDFNPLASASSAVDLAAATNGSLFLSLAGHVIDAAGNTFAGTGNNIGGVNAAGNGAGLADVTGGLAAAFFNTNSVASSFGGMADVQLGSSFSNVFLPHPDECGGDGATTGPACLTGSADFRGVIAPIPEPSTYALMLAGLGVMGFLARRRGQQA